MSTYQVTHTRKDGRDLDRRIDALKIAGQIYPIDTVIAWIENGDHAFYVDVYDRKVTVVVQKHTHSGRKFLTTEGDGFPPNNLLNLPDC